MSVYKRLVARLSLLGILTLGATLLNQPEVAITCQENCLLQENKCANNCHGSGTCATICGEVEQMCLKRCG